MKYAIICKEDVESFDLQAYLKQHLIGEETEEHPDLVVAIGGDGTFIEAIHAFPNATIFGLHTGHLGFYSNYTKKDVDALIEDINQKKYQVERLDALCCKVEEEHHSFEAYALNEMTLIMPPRTLILDVFVDEEQLETFRGTGFCISTAFGSTAYNKSLHGAVLDPALKAFQLTEIAGINSNQYRTLSSPLLLNSDRVITLSAKKAEQIYVTVDHLSYPLNTFKKATITLIEGKFQMAYHQKSHFVSRVKRAFIEKNSIN